MREDTRAAHDRVDAAYRCCDITAPDGLSLFLSDQLRAFAALSFSNGVNLTAAQALQVEYQGALEADLVALGYPMPESRERLCVTPDPALYIMLGSRRGAKLMQRHWAAHARSEARQAGAFLSLPPRDAEWRELCLDLSARPAHGPDADRMVAEVNAIFGLFHPWPAAKGRHD